MTFKVFKSKIKCTFKFSTTNSNINRRNSYIRIYCCSSRFNRSRFTISSIRTIRTWSTSWTSSASLTNNFSYIPFLFTTIINSTNCNPNKIITCLTPIIRIIIRITGIIFNSTIPSFSILNISQILRSTPSFFLVLTIRGKHSSRNPKFSRTVGNLSIPSTFSRNWIIIRTASRSFNRSVVIATHVNNSTFGINTTNSLNSILNNGKSSRPNNTNCINISVIINNIISNSKSNTSRSYNRRSLIISSRINFSIKDKSIITSISMFTFHIGKLEYKFRIKFSSYIKNNNSRSTYFCINSSCNTFNFSSTKKSNYPTLFRTIINFLCSKPNITFLITFYPVLRMSIRSTGFFFNIRSIKFCIKSISKLSRHTPFSILITTVFCKKTFRIPKNTICRSRFSSPFFLYGVWVVVTSTSRSNNVPISNTTISSTKPTRSSSYFIIKPIFIIITPRRRCTNRHILLTKINMSIMLNISKPFISLCCIINFRTCNSYYCFPQVFLFYIHD